MKLPKEVVDAIEYYQEHEPRAYRRLIMLVALQKNIEYGGSERSSVIRDFAYEEDNFELLMKALVNGYEVEYTPEDRATQWLVDNGCLHGKSARDVARVMRQIFEGGTRHDSKADV